MKNDYVIEKWGLEVRLELWIVNKLTTIKCRLGIVTRTELIVIFTESKQQIQKLTSPRPNFNLKKEKYNSDRKRIVSDRTQKLREGYDLKCLIGRCGTQRTAAATDREQGWRAQKENWRNRNEMHLKRLTEALELSEQTDQVFCVQNAENSRDTVSNWLNKLF